MISSALGIIGGVLGAAVLLYAAFNLARASDLRSTVDDQDKRIESLLREQKLDRADLAKKDAAIELLSERLKLTEERTKNLEEIVSGRIDFSALEAGLANHHSEAMRRLDEIERKTLTGLKDVKALLNAHRETDGDS